MRGGGMAEVAPLDDPRYVPAHPPVDGFIPGVVEKWGPRSQLRWFRRFRGQLRPRPTSGWARYFYSSVEHRGPCCTSCEADYWDGFGRIYDDHCCCVGAETDVP